MKRRMFFSMILVALLAICCLASADAYMVASTEPVGYCYLYDQPSSTKGRNLGAYYNGSWIDILGWNADANFAYVMTCDSEVGYMRKSSMIPLDGECYSLCYVSSTSPNGYCYLYNKPSSTEGRNLGTYYNDSPVVVLDWYADTNFAKVYTADNQTGYMRKTSLSFRWPGEPGAKTEGETYYVSGTPKGYCYLYDQPTSRGSKNLGRYNDGSAVTVLDYNADKTYAYVKTSKGSVGYIRKAYLSK